MGWCRLQRALVYSRTVGNIAHDLDERIRPEGLKKMIETTGPTSLYFRIVYTHSHSHSAPQKNTGEYILSLFSHFSLFNFIIEKIFAMLSRLYRIGCPSDVA